MGKSITMQPGYRTDTGVDAADVLPAAGHTATDFTAFKALASMPKAAGMEVFYKDEAGVVRRGIIPVFRQD
jgi:hypothetical protein